ncbi:peptidoglycan-binding outer membrane lipoprotein Pal, OmpA family [Geotalea daltonii FRC-32]|uniref:Peptidoglycan-associated protein n=1 Tax=Geotalea daltonii (strain DSM 22248 / JCM 15807 / FRC-32) TaxID=316067 RepID=B9M348_GEODF|nr:peptidoglycan-associated lipoprotein Pal [Geotalea daltonii]ACM19458.1 peptidoglycan-binding outer membrane lipoprotein Pal, OmpA family [Geotalea daltonii FRC-32]
MRKGMVGLVTVLFCGALLCGGCAKKEMVKAEEATVPPVTTEKPAVTPPAKPAPSETVKEQPIQEAPTTTAESTVKEQAPTVIAATELEKVLFDFDSFVLSPAARDTLSKNAQWLEKNKQVKVQIEGHCDERGSDEYNLALGEKRAKSAVNYLVTLGIPASQLSVISFGKEKPADPGHDEAAWAQNRRAEFVILK